MGSLRKMRERYVAVETGSGRSRLSLGAIAAIVAWVYSIGRGTPSFFARLAAGDEPTT